MSTGGPKRSDPGDRDAAIGVPTGRKRCPGNGLTFPGPVRTVLRVAPIRTFRAGERHPPDGQILQDRSAAHRKRWQWGSWDGQLTLRTGPGSVSRVAPKTVERSWRVCVRSLRTQQRTESQCQLIYRWVLLLPLRGGEGSCWCITRLISCNILRAFARA